MKAERSHRSTASDKHSGTLPEASCALNYLNNQIDLVVRL
jgi:hypothetical protein